MGEDDGEVAIYNGVSQSLGPLALSEVDEHMELATEDLTPYHRSRVASGIPADDRAHAETIVEQLRDTVEEAAAEDDAGNGQESGAGEDDGDTGQDEQNDDEQAGENSE